MEKLNSLIAELAAIDQKLDALLEGDSLSAEQQEEHDKLVNDRKRAQTAISREQDRAQREEERQKLEADAKAKKEAHEARLKAEADRQKRLETAGTGRKTDPDLPNATDAAAERPIIGDGRIRQATVIPASVKRFTLANFKGTREGLSAEQRAYRFGMWCLARLAMDLPGRYNGPGFRHAKEWVEKNISAVTSSDSNGYQYLIPEEFGSDLIDLREKYGVARRVFKMIPMSSDTRIDPRRQSGLTAYFTAEGAPGTESNKVWNEVRLTAKEIMVLSRYTAQVNADSVINVGDDLAQEIAYAFSKLEDDCAFNGDGTSKYGGIVGARTKLTNCDGAGGASAGIQAQGTGNTWSALVLADFHNLVGLLPQFAETDDVCWVAHRAFFFGVMQKLELASGGVPGREVQAGLTNVADIRGGRPTFLGYPVQISQIMPATTAVATIPVLLGNFRQGASFGDRQMDSIAFSEHASVGGESVFERNQIAIRGTERIDINVHDAGTTTVVGPIVGLKTGS